MGRESVVRVQKTPAESRKIGRQTRPDLQKLLERWRVAQRRDDDAAPRVGQDVCHGLSGLRIVQRDSDKPLALDGDVHQQPPWGVWARRAAYRHSNTTHSVQLRAQIATLPPRGTPQTPTSPAPRAHARARTSLQERSG
jgi:hypothetical protein